MAKRVNKGFKENVSLAPQKSNHDNMKSYDKSEVQANRSEKYFTKGSVKEGYYKEFERNKGVIFKRNMSERDIKLELFMLEGREEFENRSLRSRMQAVIDQSHKELKEKFFEQGLEDTLPKTWEDFKKFVIAFCSEQSIESIFKYKDESWYKYITRLKEFSIAHSVSEDRVLKKLRTQWLPQDLKIIFFSTDVKLDIAIERVREWENFRITENKSGDKRVSKNKSGSFKPVCSEKHFNKTKTNNIEDIVCFKCKEKGHFANKCKYQGKINTTKNEVVNNIDYDTVKINGKDLKVIFDTGASDSLIPLKILKNLGDFSKINQKREFTGYNGDKFTADFAVELMLEYNEKTAKIKFWVVSGQAQDIVISNKMVNILRRTKTIPINCCINTKNAGPISWNRPIRSYKEREKFEILCQDLLNRGIIEKSTSLWLNPVVLVNKKNGKLRFCVDLRRLNDLVEQDRYELPKINELWCKLRDAKYFSLIDLEDGFFQIPIVPEDREKTTFYSGRNLYQFTKMPQGFKNAPSIFQRAMNIVLNGLLGEICISYIDDILVFSKTKSEHEKNFSLVQKKLEEYGLYENVEKRIYCVEKLNFLGYELSKNNIKPTTSRKQGIMDFSAPTNKRELQRFIGLLNYDRNFIPKITEKLKPLYRLLNKDVRFCWSDVENEVFTEIKKEWSKNLELVIPDMDERFRLESDASDVGIGAVLSQKDSPVAFISRTLSKAEKNYGITEKETLAALWAMEKFAYYLIGTEFDLVTDHKPIQFIKSRSEFGSPRIMRWVERLQKFNFKPIYKKGSELIAADSLSRSSPKVTEGEESSSVATQILRCHERYSHRKTIKDNLLADENLDVSNNKILEVLEKCEVCKRKDQKWQKSCNFVKTTEQGELVGVDLMEVTRGIRVAVAIDYYTRKLFACIISTKEARKILKFLESVNKELRIKTLLSDNGREFNNSMILNWCKENGIKQKFSVAYYHQSNGRVERAIRTIRVGLRKEKGPLKQSLYKVIRNYNNTNHRGIGMSPNEATRPENRGKILDLQEKYEREFLAKNTKVEKFEVGNKVLIKNEIRKNKMEDFFKDGGKVVEVLDNNIYQVETPSGMLTRKHSTQLKMLEEGEVETAENSLSNHSDVY